MKLTEEEKKFLKNNSSILKGIFKRRFQELMSSVLNSNEMTQDDKVELKFLREYNNWLQQLGIFDSQSLVKNNKGQKDSNQRI